MDIKHALSSTTSVVFSSAATHRSSEWYREEPTSLEFKSRCVAASSRIYVKLTIATIVTLSLKRRVKQLTNAKKPITTSTWRHREEPPIHIKRDIYVWANNNVGLRPLWWSGLLCHRNHQSTWITPVEALNLKCGCNFGSKGQRGQCQNGFAPETLNTTGRETPYFLLTSGLEHVPWRHAAANNDTKRAISKQ